MSRDAFDDFCPGCRPVLISPDTGKALGPESVEMQIANRVWANTTLAERQAFHRVTCLNSRDKEDELTMLRITERMKFALMTAQN